MRDAALGLVTFLLAWVLVSSPHAVGREPDSAQIPPPPAAPAPFLAAAKPDVLLTRVYADAARDDEFVEIGNAGATAVEMGGWSLTDGEATATFPLDATLPGNGRLVVTRNATSYREDTLAVADFTFDRGEARRMEGGVPQLANAGDEVRLFDSAGSLVDAYVWGSSMSGGPGWDGPSAPATGRGEIAVRATDASGHGTDTDSATDWAGLRRYRLGQSNFDPSGFEIHGRITRVLSPDDGDGPLLSFLQSAQTSVEIGVYTFTSDRIAAILADLSRRDVHVRVLLEGAPVGGIEPEERGIVGSLLAAGAEVRWLAGGGDIVKRYRYLHAKYAVVDGRAAWIGSENFGETGFPPRSKDGNRGWSVVVEDPALAQSLQHIFEADFDPRRRDSIPAVEPVSVALPSTPDVSLWPAPAESGLRTAQLVIAPDTALDANGVLGVLAAAQKRIWVEAFYIEPMWGDRGNPFIEAALEAAHRGVSVRFLLDGSWSSVDEEREGNDDVVRALNGRARNESLDLEARLLEPRGRIQRLHNKGLVVDGRTVLISSMNWALGSATVNREIGVLLDDLDVGSFFEAAFMADWDGRPTTGPDGWRIEDPVVLVGVYAFVGVASAVSLRKLRLGDKGIKPRAKVRRRGPDGAPLRRRSGEIRVLSPELVAQPRTRSRGRRRVGRGREEARGRVRRPEGD